ncbi:hypothetical protein Y032_0098g3124 [Ancylostoma ceylanicum]|uniref:Uncharacterized protein n=1 Tax=Ancylostoma ceylanicum TaxID=53326 RepID=A0A016TIJ3_9BILA|nr:hypothetical protein Y032_0098g3124 [Ancylostoma ceylanicum]
MCRRQLVDNTIWMWCPYIPRSSPMPAFYRNLEKWNGKNLKVQMFAALGGSKKEALDWCLRHDNQAKSLCAKTK